MTIAASDLAARVLSVSNSLSVTRNGTVRLLGKPVQGLLLPNLLGTLSAADTAKLFQDIPQNEILLAMSDGGLDAQLRGCLVASAKEKTKADPSQSYFNSDIRVPLSSLKVIVNVERQRDSFLYDASRDVRYPMSYQVIENRVETLFGKGGKGTYLLDNAIDCVVKYEPLKPRFFQHPDFDDVQVFNLWSPAEWESTFTTPKDKAPPPPFFERLMGYLAEDENSRYYLEAWLRDAAFQRAEPILVLCGVPGTGKNLFVEQVAGNLAGKHNYRSASRGFNRTQFHSNVTRCRLFYLDETKLTDYVRETLKAYHNGHASIERKGVDVGDPEPLFASFAVSNNDEACIQLEHADRKFYAPDLSKKSIEDVLGRKGAKNFAEIVIKAMADTATVKALAEYLYTHYQPGESNNFLKETKTFKRICLNSYPPWLSDLLSVAEKWGDARAAIPPKSIFSRGRPPYSTVLATLLKYCQAVGENKLSAEITLEGEWRFIVNPEKNEAVSYEDVLKNGHSETL